ncbi:MAG: rhomboid family intramembrane serine protease [Elusimicrobiota bacterium]|jgi:membrane associated rhomboid family serine protease
MIPIPYADENPAPSRKTLTITLIVLNLVGLLFSSPHFVEAYGFIPYHSGSPERWLFSLFMHGGLMHLAGNMWFLWLFGDNVEARLGRWFVPFYLAAGFAAHWGFMSFNPGTFVPAIGASGAVSGVIGLYLVLFPGARMKCFILVPSRRGGGMLHYSISALVFGALYLGWEYLQLALLGERDGVAHSAHLGGVAFGLVVGALVRALEPGASSGLSGERGARPEDAASAPKRKELEALVRAGSEDAALRGYVDAVRRDPYFALSAPAQLWVADRLARHGHPHLAKDALERCVMRAPLDPLCAHAQLLLGWVQESHYHDYAAAAAAYRAAARHPRADEAVQKDAGERLKKLEGLVTRTFTDAPEAQEPCWILREDHAADFAGDAEPGVLGKALPPGEASKKADALEREGTPVLVVPDGHLLPLPKARLALGLKVDAEGMRFRCADGGEELLRWPETTLIAGCGVRMEKLEKEGLGLFETEVLAGSLGPLAGAQRTYRGVKAVLPLLEVFGREGAVRLRWAASTEPDPSAEKLAEFYGQLQQAVLLAPNVPVDRGAQAAFRRELPEEVVFDKMERLDAYLSWQLQLADLRRSVAASA